MIINGAGPVPKLPKLTLVRYRGIWFIDRVSVRYGRRSIEYSEAADGESGYRRSHLSVYRSSGEQIGAFTAGGGRRTIASSRRRRSGVSHRRFLPRVCTAVATRSISVNSVPLPPLEQLDPPRRTSSAERTSRPRTTALVAGDWTIRTEPSDSQCAPSPLRRAERPWSRERVRSIGENTVRPRRTQLLLAIERPTESAASTARSPPTDSSSGIRRNRRERNPLGRERNSPLPSPDGDWPLSVSHPGFTGGKAVFTEPVRPLDRGVPVSETESPETTSSVTTVKGAVSCRIDVAAETRFLRFASRHGPFDLPTAGRLLLAARRVGSGVPSPVTIGGTLTRGERVVDS